MLLNILVIIHFLEFIDGLEHNTYEDNLGDIIQVISIGTCMGFDGPQTLSDIFVNGAAGWMDYTNMDTYFAIHSYKTECVNGDKLKIIGYKENGCDKEGGIEFVGIINNSDKRMDLILNPET